MSRIYQLEGSVPIDAIISRGYQPPAESSRITPDHQGMHWNSIPPEHEDFSGLELPDQIFTEPTQEQGEMIATKLDEPITTPIRPGKIIAVNGPIPDNRVNLDNSTAAFLGHILDLSPASVKTIKEVLANEVVRKLKEEQERVLAALTGTTATAVADGSGEAGAKVRRVRSRRTNRRAKTLPAVSIDEAG